MILTVMCKISERLWTIGLNCHEVFLWSIIRHFEFVSLKLAKLCKYKRTITITSPWLKCIFSAQPRHTGNYTCKPSSSTPASIQLFVLGRFLFSSYDCSSNAWSLNSITWKFTMWGTWPLLAQIHFKHRFALGNKILDVASGISN